MADQDQNEQKGAGTGRPGNTPTEQQERSPGVAERERRAPMAISGPGAADFLAAPTGIDRPESADKGTGQLRGPSLDDDRRHLAPRLGPDDEAFPGERAADRVSGSQTGTVGGGGAEAHNPSPVRATRDDTADTGGSQD